MSLTIGMLTRNHARSLPRAFASVSDLGPILVADTGSTDETVSIATSAHATVISIPWSDDFAAAWNQTLAAIRTDWVLWLNPDEELLNADRTSMDAAMQERSSFAYRLSVQQQLRADSADFGSTGLEVRLFRNDPEIRYRGRVHPTPQTPYATLAAARGLTISDHPLTIRRHAYLSPMTVEKLRWMVKLLELELVDQPDRLAAMIELGRTLQLLGDATLAETHLAEATRRLRPFLSIPEPPCSEVGRLLETILSGNLPGLRGVLPLELIRGMAMRWFPVTPPVVWALAHERFVNRDYATAATHLERLVTMGQTQRYDSGGGFDPSILGPVARLNLGICYVRLGDLSNAKRHLVPLLDDPKHRDRAERLLRHLTQEVLPAQ